MYRWWLIWPFLSSLRAFQLLSTPFHPPGRYRRRPFTKKQATQFGTYYPRDNSPRAGLTMTNPHFVMMLHPVSVCIADVSSSTPIFRHVPLPVCLPPSSSTRVSLPSHLIIELGIKTINELQCLSRLPKKRKPLQKEFAACRVKEDHPTLCDDAAAVFVWPYGRASRDSQGFCPFVSRCMCVRACDNHVPCVLVSC